MKCKLFFLCAQFLIFNLSAQIKYFNIQLDYHSYWEEAGNDNLVELDSIYLIGGGTNSPYNDGRKDSAMVFKIDKFTLQTSGTTLAFDEGSNLPHLLKINDSTCVAIGRRFENRNPHIKAIDSTDVYFWKFNPHTLQEYAYKRIERPSRYEAPFGFLPTSDGGYWYSGWSFVPETSGYSSLLISKVDSNFNEVFFRLVPPIVNNWYGAGMLEVENGNVLLVGTRNYTSSNQISIIWKLNPLGQTLWAKEMPLLPKEIRSSLKKILPSPDGKYLAIGATRYYVHDNLPYGESYVTCSVDKIDTLGNRIWHKDHRGISDVDDATWFDIQQASDGNYILAGFERGWETINGALRYPQYGVVAKMKPDGNLLWKRRYTVEKFNAHFDLFYDVLETQDGGILVGGKTYADDGDSTHQNIWVMKLDSGGCATPGCDPSISTIEIPVGKQTPFVIYPNPTTGRFTIAPKEGVEIDAVRVYSGTGAEITRITKPSSGPIEVDISHTASGMCFVQCEVRGVVFVRPLVKE